MDRFRPGWVYDTTDQEPLQGQTIEELAGKLGLDPQKLKHTIDEYNGAVNDKPFDLMKLDGKATTGKETGKRYRAALMITRRPATKQNKLGKSNQRTAILWL